MLRWFLYVRFASGIGLRTVLHREHPPIHAFADGVALAYTLIRPEVGLPLREGACGPRRSVISIPCRPRP